MRPTYAAACARFSWQHGLEALGWRGDGRVNLADTIVGRHAGVALRWFGKRGDARTLAFDELSRLATRVAGVLADVGVREGDRVAGFLPRVPETLALMLGTWHAGAVYVPIFTGFGADAIAFRVEHGGAKVLCTHHEYRDRVPALPEDVTLLTVGLRGPSAQSAGDGLGASTRARTELDFAEAMAAQPDTRAPVLRDRRDPAVLLYTSGSTGPPKGVAIATNFVLAVHPWMTLGVDLQPDDVFWPTGDPGWGYGLICYMLALALGVPVVCHEAPPSAPFALARIHELGVTNLATTPTLLRGIMALGADALRPSRVRRASSCGEPLNAEVVSFFRRAWGVTVMDHYGSSEFGLPVGNLNAVDMAVKPGSMGLPLPGSDVAVVDDDGVELPAGAVGQIGVRPSAEGYYALGYWQEPARMRELQRGGFVTIGDLARRDADGYFWFEGRADDVIKSAGYRIGPFEIESAILEHPAVAEAAVVGAPDALRGHIVKAFVVTRAEAAATDALREQIVALVKERVGHHQYPRAIEFVRELPKTETGKIQRFVLRSRGRERPCVE